MKSIKTKFVALVLASVLVASASIGTAGIIILTSYADKASAEVINKTCMAEAERLNSIFSDTESAVQAFSAHVINQLDGVESMDEDYIGYYSAELYRATLSYGSNMDMTVSSYVRFSPEMVESPVSGVYYIKNKNGEFEEEPLTDLSLYDKDDTEHVGWYYIPLENGEPTWMEPYYNEKTASYTISYGAPIVYNGEPIGVVGMDIDFDAISDMVSKIKVYESGSAFLTGDGRISFNSEADMESFVSDAEMLENELENFDNSGNRVVEKEFDGQMRKLAFCTLRNGMKLVLAVSESEINAERHMLVVLIAVLAAAISAIAAVAAVIMSGRLIRPLRELDEASVRIAEGNLDTTIEWHSDDEVGVLAESFRKTTEALRANNLYIKSLAYSDVLTGAGNARAYHDAKTHLAEDFEKGNIFAVVVFDVNNLKLVNDNLGHDVGDKLIVDACEIIKLSFEPNMVYRIGGDEFVVLLKDGEAAYCEDYMENFRRNIKSYNEVSGNKFTIAVAVGYAVYNPGVDEDYKSVFGRADRGMYINKRVLKEAAVRESADNAVELF